MICPKCHSEGGIHLIDLRDQGKIERQVPHCVYCGAVIYPRNRSREFSRPPVFSLSRKTGLEIRN